MNKKMISRYDVKELGDTSVRHLEEALSLISQLDEAGANVTALRHEVTELAQQWADARPRVAVIGAFSSGKSTLLNRLLGIQAVPVSRTPTTAVATVIRQDLRRHGVLQFRQKARLTLLHPGEHPLDTGALGVVFQTGVLSCEGHPRHWRGRGEYPRRPAQASAGVEATLADAP